MNLLLILMRYGIIIQWETLAIKSYSRSVIIILGNGIGLNSNISIFITQPSCQNNSLT
jgi:hypothetical protein